MTILVILGFEKRITQRHCLDPLHIRVHDKLGINVKEHRHVHRLARIQSLLLKAKALDLAEIWRYLARRHAVCCYANDIFGRLIGRGVESQCRFAR
jgi:hypothetical protein